MHTSPFLVDLVAESERVEEEQKYRLKEQLRRQDVAVRRKESVKNEIILQALGEVSDLEALREEKRNIILEEKRLKALLDIEKAKTKRKADRLAAQRAEKERREAAGKYRRAQRMKMLAEAREEERRLLIEKLDIADESAPYGVRVGKGVIGPLGSSLG